MTEPKSISFKCERCGLSSNDFDYTFKIRREWGELFFHLLKIPVWIAATYFIVYHDFDTKGFLIGLLCGIVLLLLGIWSQPIIRCPRCEGREVKEIYHY
jgi:hypothetical protein